MNVNYKKDSNKIITLFSLFKRNEFGILFKDKLKELSGNQGYQALIRDILWNYVHQKSGDYRPQFARSDIRATVEATARKDESCALTGKLIQENQPMLLGFTIYGDLVPLSVESVTE